jgi:hypothetical protein
MWDQAEKETETKWSCEAEPKTYEDTGWNPKDIGYIGEDSRVIQFVVNRTDKATETG